MGDTVLLMAKELEGSARARLYRMRTEGKLVQLARGAYVLRENWEGISRRRKMLLRIVAHSRAKPGHITVGRTAAFVHGLPVPTGQRIEQLVELGSINGTRASTSDGLLVRHLPQGYRGQVIPVNTEFGRVYSSVPKVLSAELLLWCGQLESLVAIESMLQRGMLSLDEVEEGLTFVKGRHRTERVVRGRLSSSTQKGDLVGKSQLEKAYETLSLVTAVSESPRESEVKYELWKAGFPAPYQQVTLFNQRIIGGLELPGTFLGRVDFMFPCGLVLEYDGQEKYLRTDTFQNVRADSTASAI